MRDQQLLSVVEVFSKKWKLFVIVSAVSILTGTFVSFFIPEYYETNFSFLAQKSNSYDPYYVLNSKISQEADIFGDKNDIVKAAALLKDKNFKLTIIEKSGLIDHYGLTDSGVKLSEMALAIFDSRVKLTLNKEDGLFTIKVLDKDREKCLSIADSILYHIELFLSNGIRKRNKNIGELLRSNIVNKKKEIDSLNERLNYLRSTYMILDSKTQSEYLVKNILYKNNIKENVIDNYLKGIEEVKMIESILENQILAYSNEKDQYVNLMSSLNKSLHSIIITQSPSVKDKVSKPGKIIVIAGFFIVSILSTLIFVLFRGLWLIQKGN